LYAYKIDHIQLTNQGNPLLLNHHQNKKSQLLYDNLNHTYYF
jgi:hypothetical protein